MSISYVGAYACEMFELKLNYVESTIDLYDAQAYRKLTTREIASPWIYRLIAVTIGSYIQIGVVADNSLAVYAVFVCPTRLCWIISTWPAENDIIRATR